MAASASASAPKSNATYVALGRAAAEVERHGSLPVPLHLRNAPTPLMKAEGYGRDYEYAHDAPDAFVARKNLPEGVSDAPFYQPSERGAERGIGERLAAWRRRRTEAEES